MSERLPPIGDRLYRSTHDRVIAGVCGGLADRFDVDPSLVRVGWVLVGILTGVVPLLLLYVLMAMVVPEEPAGFLESMPISPPEGTAASAAWKAAQEAEWAARRVARRAGRARRGTDTTLSMLVGAALVVIGGTFLLRQWFVIDWDVLWAAGLIAVGVLVLLSTYRR